MTTLARPKCSPPHGFGRTIVLVELDIPLAIVVQVECEADEGLMRGRINDPRRRRWNQRQNCDSRGAGSCRTG